MNGLLTVHIIGASIALATGYVALYATKGAGIHRKSGLWFVGAMTIMGVTGAIIAAIGVTEVSVVAGLSVTYLVISGLTTVRPRTPAIERIDTGMMVFGLAIGVPAFILGIHTLGAPGGTRDGLPAFPFFMLGLPPLLGGIADIHVLRNGGLKGAPRIVRHLWRMSYALLIAALSFFLGQADELPAAMRHPAIASLPVLAVLVTMLYWLWRVRVRRSLRGLLQSRRPEVAL